jgi:mannitol 2-dehydrogenase
MTRLGAADPKPGGGAHATSASGSRRISSSANPTLPARTAPHPASTGAYKRTLIERFSDACVADTVARLCADGSDRLPTWLLPVIREQLDRGGEIRRSAAIVASWARNAEGVDEQGAAIEVVDRRRDRLVPAARRQREHPTSFIEVREVFGDIAEDARFVEAYPRTLELLHERGARATLAALASDGVRSVPQQLRSPG